MNTPFRFQPRVKNLRSYLPILDVIRHYRRDDWNHDLVAGLVLGVITIPQAVAYAFLAGLPAQAGLYACLVPMVLYALLGSSRHLVVGPVAVAALMVAATIGRFAPENGDAYLGISTILCLQVGIILLLLRALKLGGVVNLLSHPVITGFINAAAILIIITQLDSLLGIEGIHNPDALSHLALLVAEIDQLNVVTLIFGLASFTLLGLVSWLLIPGLKRLGIHLKSGHPLSRIGPVVVAVVAITVVSNFNLDTNYQLATVGFVPGGLPSITLPPFDLTLWGQLVPYSISIALVAYVESYSVGATLANRERTRVNHHQELIALGAANIGAAFTGAYPVAGSFSRSSVNYQAGGRTTISSLVCMFVIVLTLLFFTPLFERLPHAALAAIIIISVIGLMDFASLKRHWQFYRRDAITQGITFVTVIVFGITTGLLTGVIASIAFFIHRSSKPKITIVGRVDGGGQFRSARRFEVETETHIAAARIDENIYFANASQVENKLIKAVQRRPDTKHLILVCSSINLVDISGLEMLYRLNQNLDAAGVCLHMSDVKGPVMNQLDACDFVSQLTGSVFFSTDQAMTDLSHRE